MDANYQGSCVVKGIGDYADPAAIGLANDSISSIKVGSGANVRLCDNAGLNGPCEFFGADDPDLSNNMINTNTASSMKVEGGGPTTNCVPAESEVAFFMGENYQETCIIRGVGRYDDPAALGLPNDTISSVKIGSRVRVRICANDGNNSPCDQFENNIPNLGPTTVQNNTASSAEITSRGGIALCDGNNGSGDCRYYGAGATGISYYNMSDQGFDNRARSVRYDSDWAGLYHIVLYVDQNQTGALYHADNSVGDLGTPYSGNISSIQVYRHQPPTARIETPLNGAMLPATATSVNLVYNGGNQKRVHVWTSAGYDFDSGWRPEDSYLLTNLVPGTYSWQVQGRNQIGDGPWSPVQTFTINTPPTVAGGELTMNAGTSQTIQVQAHDADQNPVTLSAANLPSFASFTDNGGIGTLNLNPGATAAGQYAITITASDGGATGTGIINVTVNPSQPTGYQAVYFNNLTLSGTPVLSRDETTVDYDWGGGSPGSGVNTDNFSARWTKTTDFAAGTYTFSVTADDGVRLYIDGVLSIDKWIDQGATTYTVNKTLVAGAHTIVTEYYERGGGAVAKLSYQPLTVLPPAPGITSGNTYKLVNPNSSKALDVDGGTAADGTNVHIWTDNGGAAQKWRITRNEDGTYKLINPGTSRALDVNGGGTADGTNVQIWTDNGGSAQKWRITQNGDGTYKLVNPQSSKALDVNGGGSADGTRVQIWTDNHSAAQQWQIVDVTPAAPPPTTPPVVRSASSGNASSGTLTLSKPDGTTNGDLLILTATADLNASEVVTYTVASGWRPLLPLTRSDVNGAGNNLQAWYKLANGEPSSYTITPDHANLIGGSVIRIDGHDPSNPFDVSAVTAATTGEALAPAVMTTVSNALVLRLATWDQSRTVNSAPTGVTNIYYVDVSGHDSWAGYAAQVTAGSTGLAQFDLSGTAPYVGYTLAFRPAGAPSPAPPTFTGNSTVTPASLSPGATVTMNATFTSTSNVHSTTRIHLEIRNPSDQQVYARDFDNEDFSPGQTKTYTATWTIPQNAPAGSYTVKGGAVSADWGTWYLWLNAAGSFTITAPSGGTELLTSAWNLTGNNGASERYQTIASSALAGKTTLRITYNLHGLQALGGDASAIIFDQNGWKYVSLSGYGQNGLNGSQTVDIPLSAFGLDLSQPVGTLHTRFWYGGTFTVDITSIQVL